jgi:hypothetical protein
VEVIKTDQLGLRSIVNNVAKTGQKVWLVPVHAYAGVLSERLLFSLIQSSLTAKRGRVFHLK